MAVHAGSPLHPRHHLTAAISMAVHAGSPLHFRHHLTAAISMAVHAGSLLQRLDLAAARRRPKNEGLLDRRHGLGIFFFIHAVREVHDFLGREAEKVRAIDDIRSRLIEYRQDMGLLRQRHDPVEPALGQDGHLTRLQLAVHQLLSERIEYGGHDFAADDEDQLRHIGMPMGLNDDAFRQVNVE